MRKVISLFLIALNLQGVIRRTDLPDSLYIEFGKDQRFSCVGFVTSSIARATGTLIHPNIVLTAAHVVNDKEHAFFYIKDPHTEKTIAIKGFAKRHESFFYRQNERGFVQEIHHDIALIYLTRPIYEVEPARLDDIPKFPPLFFVAAGFGKHLNHPKKPPLSDQVRRGFTNRVEKIFETSLCSPYFISYFDPPGSEQSTNLEGLATHGDSGSPIFLESEGHLSLFGIVSLVSGNGSYGSFNAILPIFPYLDWISSP